MITVEVNRFILKKELEANDKIAALSNVGWKDLRSGPIEKRRWLSSDVFGLPGPPF